MKKTMRMAVGVAAVSVAVLTAAGCSDDNSDSATSSSSAASSMMAEGSASAPVVPRRRRLGRTDRSRRHDGHPDRTHRDEVRAATAKQKTDLGKPKTGADASGTGANGVVFQQFDGGVIERQERRGRYAGVHHVGQDPRRMECAAQRRRSTSHRREGWLAGAARYRNER